MGERVRESWGKEMGDGRWEMGVEETYILTGSGTWDPFFTSSLQQTADRFRITVHLNEGLGSKESFNADGEST